MTAGEKLLLWDYGVNIEMKREKGTNIEVDTFHCEYPHAFKNEEEFDAFYMRLTKLQREYQIYLDEEVSRQLDMSVGVYTRLKQWMDAFCDTEHVVDLKVKKEVALYGKVFMSMVHRS